MAKHTTQAISKTYNLHNCRYQKACRSPENCARCPEMRRFALERARALRVYVANLEAYAALEDKDIEVNMAEYSRH